MEQAVAPVASSLSVLVGLEEEGVEAQILGWQSELKVQVTEVGEAVHSQQPMVCEPEIVLQAVEQVGSGCQKGQEEHGERHAEKARDHDALALRGCPRAGAGVGARCLVDAVDPLSTLQKTWS